MTEFSVEQTNETEVGTEVNHDFDEHKTTINRTVEQTVDVETFMDMFNEKVNTVITTQREISNMETRIDQLLEDHETDMEILHSIDESQQQSSVPEQARGNSVPNSVDPRAFEVYGKLQQARQQNEQKQRKLEDAIEDFEALQETAKMIVDEYESIEMPNNYERVVEYLEEDGESEEE